MVKPNPQCSGCQELRITTAHPVEGEGTNTNYKNGKTTDKVFRE